MPEVCRDADGHRREHDVSEEATGVTLRAESIDDGSEKWWNDEAAERAKSADKAGRAANRLRHIFRHHLEHRRIADPHSEGDQQFTAKSQREFLDESEHQRAGQHGNEGDNRGPLAADALGNHAAEYPDDGGEEGKADP